MEWKIRHDELRADRILKNKYTEELGSYLAGRRNVYEIRSYNENIEKSFCAKFGYNNFSLLGSGTEAFSLLLWLLSLENENKEVEIIVPAVEYRSIISSFSLFPNLKVRLCDVNQNDLTIDTGLIQEAVNKDTRAIIVAHMFGNPCNMEKLRRITKEYGLKLIEDVCQAIGNKHDDKYLGSLGDSSFFSFSHSKMISSFGNGKGGAFSLNYKGYENYLDSIKKDKILKGITDISLEESIGVGIKLKYFDYTLKHHEEMKKVYFEGLSALDGIGLVNSDDKNKGLNAKMAVVLETEELRNRLFSHLKKEGIIAEMPYIPLSEILKSNSKFPNADRYSRQGLHLPFFPFINEEEIKLITDSVKSFFANRK